MRKLILTAVIVGFFLPAAAWAAQTLQVYNPSGVRVDGVYVDDALLNAVMIKDVNIPTRLADFPHEPIEKIQIKKDA